MPLVIFNFARDLKFSRFTIDVLMQRIAEFHPPRHRAPQEYESFIGPTREKVSACDQLHQELSQQFHRVRSWDPGSVASISARFEEFHRRLADAIASLNALVREKVS